VRVANVVGEYVASRVVTLSAKCSSDRVSSFPCCDLLFNAGMDEVESRR
jgi:hypothetical protein